MALADFVQGHDPLDPLRRFVATPLRTKFRAGAACVSVQTNDFRLLPELPLDTESGEPGGARMEWKLVRDHDVPGLLEEMVEFSGGGLTVAFLGAACMVAVDQERGELLSFIGYEVDARTFQETLVPFFRRLTEEAAARRRAGTFLSEQRSLLQG